MVETPAPEPPGPPDAVSWTPDLPAPGNYEVFVKYQADASRASAVYTIVHAGGNTDVPLDQTQNGGIWVSLGSFDFDAGTTGSAAILSSLVAAWLLAPAVLDPRTPVLPNIPTLPLIPAGLMVAVYFSPQALNDHLIGPIPGWGVFVSVGALFARPRGRPGLGGGAAELPAAAGAWLGWQAIPLVIAIAGLAGPGLVGWRIIPGRKIERRPPPPLGPSPAFAFPGVWPRGPLIQL